MLKNCMLLTKAIIRKNADDINFNCYTDSRQITVIDYLIVHCYVGKFARKVCGNAFVEFKKLFKHFKVYN